MDLATLGLKLEATQMVTGAEQASRALQQLGQEGTRTQAAVAGTNRQVVTLGPTFTSADRVLRTTRAQFAGLVATLVPLPPQLTRVGVAMSGLAISGGVTVGVLAGLAALVAAYRKLTEGAREAEKAQRDLLKQAQETAAGIGVTEIVRLGLARAAILEGIADKEAEIRKESELAYRAVGEAERLQRELNTLTTQEAQIMGQIVALQQAATKADQERLRAERERANVDTARPVRFRLQALAQELDLAEQLTDEHAQFLETLQAEADAVRDAVDPTRELLRQLQQLDDLVLFGQLSPAEAQALTRQLLEDLGNAAAAYEEHVERASTAWERQAAAVDRMRRSLSLVPDVYATLTGRDTPASQILAGAQTGFDIAGPPGAFLGGLVSGIGAVIDRSREWEQSLRRLEAAIADFGAVFSSDLESAIRAIRSQAEDLRRAVEEQFNELFMGEARGQALEEINRLEAERIQLLREQAAELERQRAADLRIRFATATGASTRAVEDLRFAENQRRELREAIANARSLSDVAALIDLLRVQAAERAARVAEFQRLQEQTRQDLEVRRLFALGQDAAANALAFRLQQEREYAEAVRAGADALTLAKLAEVQRVEAVRFQLTQAEQQVAAAEQATAATRRTVEALRAFSVAIGGQISQPGANIAALRQQFETVAAQARLGDQAAAARLPDLGRQLLDASRGYFASGPGFVAEAVRVQRLIDELTAQFADQLTAEEQILAAAIAQRDALQGLLDEITGENDRRIEWDDERRRWRQEDTSAREADRKTQADQQRERLAKQDEVIAAIGASTTDSRKELVAIQTRLDALTAAFGQGLTGLKVS